MVILIRRFCSIVFIAALSCQCCLVKAQNKSEGKKVFYGIRAIVGIKNYWVSQGTGHTYSSPTPGYGVFVEYRFSKRMSVIQEFRQFKESETTISFQSNSKTYNLYPYFEQIFEFPLYITYDFMLNHRPFIRIQAAVTPIICKWTQPQFLLVSGEQQFYVGYTLGISKSFDLRRNFWPFIGIEFDGNTMYSEKPSYQRRPTQSPDWPLLNGAINLNNVCWFINTGVKF